MSRENVETARRAFEAWNADDLDAALALLDPEVEWHPSIEPALEGGETTYRGLDGMRKAWDDYRGGAWERLTVRIQEIRDLGESVLVLGHIDLTARATRIRFHEEVGLVMTFRGGKILRSEDYLSHAKVLEAAGLSDQAMSHENVEIVRRCFDDYRRGAPDEALAWLAPDVVWEVGQELPARGPDAVRDLWERWESDWEALEMVREEFIDAGDKVLVTVHYSGRGRGSGVPFDDRLFDVYTLREGKIIHKREFRDRSSALQAAGLRE